MTHPLVDEAAKKAGIAWVSVDGGPAYAVWCLTLDNDVCVVTGPGEQDLPGLGTASSVVVTLRGDHGGAIVSYPVTVNRIRPESDRWETVAPQLASKRLNVSGTAEDLIARWAKECALWGLSQAGEPADRDTSAQRAEPRPAEVANATRKPFKLHRVRRRPAE
jgi:hypothetical protein